MDALETQNSVDCDGHVALYFQSERIDSKRVQLEVSAQYSLDHKKQYKISVPNGFGKTLTTKSEVSKELEPSTFHPLPHVKIPLPQEVFLPKSSSEATAMFVLRIHGRLGLEEPLDDHFVALQGCVVQRCFASGAAAPRPKPASRTEPRGTKGRKSLKQFWRLKYQISGNCGQSKSNQKPP